ncbi:MAG: carboxypeptidase regulatory-like domain-containing protein [Armatimonadetes bacterium]|nr:carboxypeptidase regulatory-like domain-containing protein [Armatimonadota bacterium]
MSNSRLISLVTYLLVVLVLSSTPTSADKPTVNNPYGVHLLLSDLSAPNLDKYLTWAKNLVGKHGYVKQLFLPVIPQTTGAAPDWKLFVQKCYEYDLIPVVRLCSSISDGGVWQKPVADGPNNYHSIAEAIKKVVADLPRYDDHPLYIEVFNEPNNHYEWSGKSDPVEYGHFFVQVAKAIHSIGDPRIKVMNGALSPGGSYDNLKFIDVMCREVPGFIDSFDVWASHPYPIGPPQINRHNGTLAQKKWQYGIDGYLAELDVLAKYGRKNVKVMLTETGYSLTAEGEDFLADQTLRAFRDCWSQWPEVLAVLPFTFNDPYGGFASGDWVYTDSGTDENGLPTKAHGNYWAVYKLAKPVDPWGSISGKITEGKFGRPIKDAEVVLSNGTTTRTDSQGNYWFPKLKPGQYKIKVSARGYKPQASTDLVVSAGTNTVGNMPLEPIKQATIVGTIRDAVTGKGLEGVKVSLQPGGFMVTTDKYGRYSFDSIPPCGYTLTAGKQGVYTVRREGICVEPGERIEIELTTGHGRPPVGTNLLCESSFEKGDEGPAGGWTIWEKAQQPGAIVVDRSNCFTGTASQKIEPRGSARNHVWQMTNYSSIEPGKTYRIEVWAKCEDADGEVRLVGTFFTNETVELGSFTGSPILTGTTGWTKLVAVGTAPVFPEGKKGRLQVQVVADLKSGRAWFDEAWAGRQFK